MRRKLDYVRLETIVSICLSRMEIKVSQNISRVDSYGVQFFEESTFLFI